LIFSKWYVQGFCYIEMKYWYVYITI
jgi:hypothetical protein